MVEPISLGAIGALALTEGIKFLYTQAGELLKNWRERRDGAHQQETDPELRPPADLIEGTVDPTRPNIERLEALEGELREQRRAIADYADGVEAIDPADAALLKQVDELRRLIEVVYGQRITFKGEVREPSGPLVENEVRAMEATIRSSKVGVVDGVVGAAVTQTTDVTGATIDQSEVGIVRGVSPSRKEDQP